MQTMGGSGRDVSSGFGAVGLRVHHKPILIYQFKTGLLHQFAAVLSCMKGAVRYQHWGSQLYILSISIYCKGRSGFGCGGAKGM